MKTVLYFPAVVMGFSSDAALVRAMQPVLCTESGADRCNLADELAGMRQREQLFMHLKGQRMPGQESSLLLVARAEGRAGIGLVMADKGAASLEEVQQMCHERNEALPPGMTAVPVPAFLVREVLQ